MTGLTPLERIARARTAYRQWVQKPVAARARSLGALRRAIATRRETIVDTLCRETGKPPLDALAGDIMVTLEQLRFYEKHAARILRPRSVAKPAFLYTGARFMEHYEPHGVALIYAPANYPFQLAVVPAATALFAGNAVLVKCSENTPQTARLIASLFAEAGLPPDLAQVVADPPPAAAAYLDAQPDMVFFTGSCEHGRSVARRAAELLIPAVLELGGKDAAVVFADCDLPRTVEGITFGAFSNSGRVCVGTRRLYIEQSIYSSLLQSLAARAHTLRSGRGADSDLGAPPGSLNARLIDMVHQALQKGARLIFPSSPSMLATGPVILADVAPSSALLQDETFGPILCAAPFHDEADAVAQANSTPFALSASVWTRDPSRGRRVAAALDAGSCAVNDVIRNIANPHASFGGNRQSGYGRYHGPQGLYAFSRIKSVMTTRSARHREIHWFPFTPSTFRRLDALLALRHRAGSWTSALRRLFLMLLISASLLPPLALQADPQPHLKITVSLPPNSRGPIAYLLFASRDGFPDNKAKAIRSGFEPAPGAAPATTFDIGPLPPGRYAVSVYQDVNGNHHLDRNFFGIPREPVGASNNPKPSFGPPRFEQCAFQMNQSDQTITIALVSPK
jgi:acyl-CoA reductase-like NAD-dependent aldehyde dehydrogenase/uncharacterized protein (DUF2141 family)